MNPEGDVEQHEGSVEHDAAIRALWRWSPLGAVILRGGRVTEMNPAAADLLGVAAERLVGHALEEFGTWAADGGEFVPHAGRANDLVCEARRIPVDGAELVILRDVTRFRQVERSLRERNAQLTSTLESIPFDFWMNDLNNCTIVQNPASRALWGEQYGHHMSEVTADAEILASWERSNRLALAGQTYRGEITYRIDGKPRVFRNVVAPVRGEEKIIGILGLNIEITDLKQALSDRDAVLRELHHWIRNNLQLMLSLVSLHSAGGLLEEAEVLRRLEQQMHGLCALHDQLYRSESVTAVDVGEYMSHVVQDLATGGRFVAVHYRYEPVFCAIERAIPAVMLLNEVAAVSARKLHGGELAVRFCVEELGDSAGDGAGAAPAGAVAPGAGDGTGAAPAGAVSPESAGAHGGAAVAPGGTDAGAVSPESAGAHGGAAVAPGAARFELRIAGVRADVLADAPHGPEWVVVRALVEQLGGTIEVGLIKVGRLADAEAGDIGAGGGRSRTSMSDPNAEVWRLTVRVPNVVGTGG